MVQYSYIHCLYCSRGRGTHHERAEGTNGDTTVPISPCLPILLPGGAVIPAMKAATGLESPYKRKQTPMYIVMLKSTAQG